MVALAYSLTVARPYVLAFLIGFLVLAVAERGVARALRWLVVGTFIGWLAEAASIRTGVPFGGYVYHSERFPREAWVAGIPLFASLSFAFMSYFARSAAVTVLGTLTRGPTGLVRAGDAGRTRPLAVPVTTALLCVWMDMAIDPVSLLGEHWFLGDLYHYTAAGEHLGVPLTNYAGWFLTVLAIATADHALERRTGTPAPAPERGPFRLPWQPILGLVGCGGVFAFVVGVAGWLTLGRGLEEARPALLSGAALLVAFVLFAVSSVWRALARGAALGTPAAA